MPLTIGTGRALLTAKPVVGSANAAIVSSSTGSNGLVGSVSTIVTAPASIVAGNLLLAVASSGTETWTPPSGWALFGTQPLSGSSPQVSVFSKTATGAEPGSYTFTNNNGAVDATNILVMNLSGSPTPSINGMFSKYTSTAATTIGTAAVSIPSVLNCLPIAISSINQLNLSNAGNPTLLTGGWTGQALAVQIDGGNPGNTANNNGYNATYAASGPITSSTSTAITAGWTWGGSFSNFTGTSVMLFIAP